MAGKSKKKGSAKSKSKPAKKAKPVAKAKAAAKKAAPAKKAAVPPPLPPADPVETTSADTPQQDWLENFQPDSPTTDDESFAE